MTNRDYDYNSYENQGMELPEDENDYIQEMNEMENNEDYNEMEVEKMNKNFIQDKTWHTPNQMNMNLKQGNKVKDDERQVKNQWNTQSNIHNQSNHSNPSKIEKKQPSYRSYDYETNYKTGGGGGNLAKKTTKSCNIKNNMNSNYNEYDHPSPYSNTNNYNNNFTKNDFNNNFNLENQQREAEGFFSNNNQGEEEEAVEYRNYNNQPPEAQDSEEIENSKLKDAKIREMSKRIKSLEDYQVLLEKRVLHLVPGHPLPVEEKHFSMNPLSISSCTDPASKQIIVEMKSQIEDKENEIFSLKKELELLQQKVEAIIRTPSEKRMKFIQKEKKTLKEFPVIEKLTDDLQSDLALTYSALLESYTGNLTEKENILKSLRNETIQNEEQKNYIEILRQTIESQIFKNGLSNTLNMQKTYYKGKGENISNVDIMIDINKLMNDSEKHRKDAVMSGVLVTELKQEINHLKKINEDFEVKYNRLKELKETVMYELEEQKGNNYLLESEKKDSSNLLAEYKSTTDKLSSEVDVLLSKIRGLEKELHENQKKLSGAVTQLENQNELQGRIKSLKHQLDSVTMDLNYMSKEKIGLEAEVENLKEEVIEYSKEKEEDKTFLSNMKEENDKYINLKNTEIDNLNKMIRKGEKQNNELLINNKEKDREIKKLNDLVTINERNISTLKCQIGNLEKEVQRKDDENEKDCFKLEQVIKESQISLMENSKETEKLAVMNEKLKNEIKSKEAEIKANREEARKLNRQINNLTETNNNHIRNLKLNESELLKIKADEDRLGKEVKYWQEKYEKDLGEKIIEITGLIDNLSNQKIDNSNLANQVSELKNRMNMEVEEKNEVESRLAFREGQVKSLEHFEKEAGKYKDESSLLKNELEGISRERENLIRYNNELKQGIEVVVKEKTVLEEALRKYKQNSFCLEEDVSQERMKVKELYSVINEIKHENLRLTENIGALKKDFNDLKIDNEALMKRESDYHRQYNLANDEKNSLERQRVKFLNEKEDCLNKHDELREKMSSLQGLHNEIRINFNSLNSMILSSLAKFENGFKQESKSKNLNNFIAFSYSLRPLNDNSLPDQICFTEDFIKVFSYELEQALVLNEQMMEKIDELQYRVSSLEEKNSIISKENDDLRKTEKDINLRLLRSEENSKVLYASKETCNEKASLVNLELKEAKTALSSLREQKQHLEKELAKYEQIHYNLNNEIKRMLGETEKSKLNSSAMESRLVVLLKEKKYYVELINILSRAYYNNVVHNTTNEIMNHLDEISELEREKLKLDGRLNSTEKEMKKQSSLEEKTSNSIKFSLMNEIEQVRTMLKENSNLIEERNQIVKKLENDIKELSATDKKKFDSITEYELKIRKLNNELNQLRNY